MPASSILPRRCDAVTSSQMNNAGIDGDVCIQVRLSESEPTADLPPDLPVHASVMQEQTVGSRLQGRHRSGDGGCPKADIVRRTATGRVWDISAFSQRQDERKLKPGADIRRLSGRHGKEREIPKINYRQFRM